MSLSLKELTAGETGLVKGFGQGGKAYRKKLLALGLTPGVEFSVVRLAPMGDPIEIRVRGCNLSLRKAEADTLIVERV